jgi:hypothetical protein
MFAPNSWMQEPDGVAKAELVNDALRRSFGMRHAIWRRIPTRSISRPEELTMSTRDPKQPDRTTDDAHSSSTADDAVSSNMRKDPDEWVTGNESMTGAQASYLKTLSEEAGEPFDEDLTKAEASKKIDELQSETGRGIDH